MIEGKEPLRSFFMNLNPEQLKGNFEKDQIVAGSYPSDEKDGVFITEKQVDELYGKKVKNEDAIGKKVQTIVSSQVDGSKQVFKTVEQEMEVLGVVKNGPFGQDAIYITYNLARDLYKESTDNETFLQGYAIAKDVQKVEQVKKTIEKQGLFATTSDEFLDKINSYFVMIQAALGMFAGISLIVSAIMIGIVMYVSVLQRTKEIGTMKALGARGKDIRRIFLSEATVIGFLGGTIGVGSAYLLGLVGNKVLESVLKENAFTAFMTPWYLVLGCIAFSMVISMLAGFIPARKAANQNAVDALSYE